MDLDPLTLPPDELRRLGYRVIDALVAHVGGLRELPPIRTGSPAELRDRLGGPPPDAPGDADAALDRLLSDVLPFMQHDDHPRFFARVGSPSNAVSVLADALASATNAFAGSWVGGSGPTALELVVLDWLRSWVGLPEETEGILVSGGSVGSLTALAAAREALPDGAKAWCSDQTHASVLRALRLLQIDYEVLPSDADYRLPADRIGGEPAIIIGTAG